MIFFIEKKNWKDSNNFWHRKLTLKVRNWQFLMAWFRTYVDLPKKCYYHLNKLPFHVEVAEKFLNWVCNMFQPICIKYPESRQYCLHHHTKVPTGLIFWRLRTCFNNHCNMTHNVHNIPSIYLLLWPVMNNFWKWKDKK